MALITLKITDFLIPTERILYHRLPKPKAPGEGEGKFIPFFIGLILFLSTSPLFIISLLLKTTQIEYFTFFIILLTIGIVLILIGIWPVISYNKAKGIEIIITNQRILIYPSPYAEKNRPKIINLAEVNGDIHIKYNNALDTGSIYIPSPHWDRLNQSGRIIFGNYVLDPDIKDIKDPFKVYNILIEAIQAGKKSKWKF